MKCSECEWFESWHNGYGCCLILPEITKRNMDSECKDKFTEKYAVSRNDGTAVIKMQSVIPNENQE